MVNILIINIYIDFGNWENLREEISLTSRKEMVNRIVETGQRKFKDGFGFEFFYSENIMKRKVQKALNAYLSSFDGFFLSIFTRPFPWQFSKQETVRKYFSDFVM